MSGRIRTLKPEWLEDELLAAASDAARTLSVALILMADDYGRGRAPIATIAFAAWRFEIERDDGAHAPETLAKASRALRELVEIRFVTLYDVAGQRYFAIRNWEKHQRVDHRGKERLPPPPDDAPCAPAPERDPLRDPRESLARPSRDLRPALAPDLVQIDGPDPDPDRGPGRARDPSEPRAQLEHLHRESKRLFGRAWFGVAGVTAAWDGGGRRAEAADAERARSVCEWAVDADQTGGLDPPAAITRALEGYARTLDRVVVSARRPFALFASSPGRWLTASAALSSAPSNFDHVDGSRIPDFMDPEEWKAIDDAVNG